MFLQERNRPLKTGCFWAICLTFICCSKKPEIKFKENPFTITEVADTGVAKIITTVYNVGGDTLRISSIKPSCGCTAFLAKSLIVAPHDSENVTIRFDPHGKVGPIRKTVLIRSNASNNPQVFVLLATVNHSSMRINNLNNIFQGNCGRCHSEPAVGKAGWHLYQSVCAMCHEEKNNLLHAPSFRKMLMAQMPDSNIDSVISNGIMGTNMPSFIMHGPPPTNKCEA